MIRSLRIVAAGLLLSCLPLPDLSAQVQKGGEFIPGTVVSIEKDKTGKNYKMKVKNTADDSEFDVPILPRTALVVSAKGDEGFLRKDVIILVRALKGQTEFSGKDFTVFLGAGPNPHLTPDPGDATKTVFEMAGKVLASQEGALMVQCGPQPQKLTIEPGATVTVKVNNAALIKEGDSVEVDGTLIKSKKQLNAKLINVTASEELKADEYFAALDEKKSKTKSKTTSKTKDGDAGTAAGESSDPFGVLKGKKAPATKKSTEKDADAKKEETTKDDPKKESTKEDKPAGKAETKE